jgi:hypothetical protein
MECRRDSQSVEQDDEKRDEALPDMWNLADGKRGGGLKELKIFQSLSVGADKKGLGPGAKMENIVSVLKLHAKVVKSQTIVNWTVPFVSAGSAPNTGLVFSRGKGNKLHVLRTETLATEW